MPHITLTDWGWRCNDCGYKNNNPGLNHMMHQCPPLPPQAMHEQIGGNHYKNMAIQPVEFIHKNGIGYMEGNAIKYLTRWKSKGGIEDLKKARHYIDLLIEMEGK